MSLWVSTPALQLDEVVTFRAAANVQRGWRSVGGQVTVTDRRLMFVPNRLDAVSGGRRVDVTLAEIVGVDNDGSARNFQKLQVHPAVTVRTVDDAITLTVRDGAGLRDALRR